MRTDYRKCTECGLIVKDGQQGFEAHPKRPLVLVPYCKECCSESFEEPTKAEVQDFLDAAELEREMHPPADRELRTALIDIGMSPGLFR